MAAVVLMMPSPIGRLAIHERDGSVTEIDFAERAARVDPALVGESDLLLEARDQLTAYFDGRLRDFDLPLDPRGSDFQRAVWRELCTIPWGTTTSYGAVAAALGLGPAGSRAVGSANGSNPIPIVVPCHRVIGSDGSMTGYGGGLERKETLLRIEGVPVPSDQRSLF